MSRVASCVALCGCLLLLAGCGASSEPASDHKAPAIGPIAANAEGGPSVETAVAVAEAEATAAAQAEVPKTPPPTAEQLKKWTPAPFEPLELLSIQEWEKTSFTSRIAALPDGKHYLVVGSRVLLWALGGSEPEHVFLELTEEDGDRHQQALGVAPDGKWFAVGDSEGNLRLWNLGDQSLSKDPSPSPSPEDRGGGLGDKSEIATKKIYPTGIQDLAISPDGKELATITYSDAVMVWSADTLAALKTFQVDTTGLKRIDYVAPGVLAVAGETTSAWNTSTGEKVTELSAGRYSSALARSADETTFVFGGGDKLVIWDVKDAKPAGEITHEVSGREQVAISPDGKHLAVNSGRTIQIWNLAERRIVQVIDSYGWAIADVCWLPETNLLAVASDVGVTRIWGTAEQGAAVGLKPVHAAATEYAMPATPVQMHGVIDLRTLPRLPESELSIAGVDDLSCVAPVSIAEAMTFYRHFLSAAGWSEVAKATPNPGLLVFTKDGFRLTAAFYEAGPGQTSVMLNHGGNLEIRSTPKFDGGAIEPVHESDATVMYRTKADLLTIETNLLRNMAKAGWTPYTRLNTSQNEEPDARDLEFLKNGTTLRVSVGKFPSAPAEYTIQYARFSNEASVPVPPDAGYVEFDGSTDPKLIAITALSLEEARDFYDKELAKEGWLVRGKDHTMKEEYAWLNYLWGQNDLTIGLTKLPDGRTLVRVGQANGSLWQGSLPKEKEEGEAEKVVVGIEAADFPILNASKTAKYDPVDKTIEVVMEDSTLANAAEIYSKAIEALGWKHDGRGIRDEEYTLLTFEKDDEDFSLRANPKDGNAVVSFSGDGLLWTKPLPGGKELVSYERWLRLNKLPPSLATLDRYETEMKAIVPSE